MRRKAAPTAIRIRVVDNTGLDAYGFIAVDGYTNCLTDGSITIVGTRVFPGSKHPDDDVAKLATMLGDGKIKIQEEPQ